MTEEPPLCPHCGRVLLGPTHCGTCRWIVHECRAMVDTKGRHIHPDHGKKTDRCKSPNQEIR